MRTKQGRSDAGFFVCRMITLLSLLGPCVQISNQRPLAVFNKSGEEHQLIVPIFINARYSTKCTHNVSVEPCPSSSSSSDSQQCFIWRAGSDLPAIAEVCVSGPVPRDDQALLMYGLTMQEAAALRQQAHAAADSSSSESSSSSSSEAAKWLSGLDSQESSNEEPFGSVAYKPLQHWDAGEL